MRKLVDADCLHMPWKNGGGITKQLAVSPHGATLDDFDWRISTAQVNSAGPFSAFPGIDRSLAVLQGAGLVLSMEDKAPFVLKAGGELLFFTGDRRVHAELLDGPIVDFNVMTRRERCTHMLRAMEIHGSEQIARQADLLFIHCAQGGTVECCCATGEPMQLSAGESILADRNDGDLLRICAAMPAHLYIAQINLKESDHVR